MFDKDGSGLVASADLEDILEKVGRDPVEGKGTIIILCNLEEQLARLGGAI